jgi:glycosyltransferase involved in cell wall biosynthesis
MLSIIVSWRDRHELTTALPNLLAACRSVDGDLTIVNFTGSASLLDEQIGEHRTAVRVVHVHGQRYFNKAAAQNVGAANSHHPILFFCDCDILLNSDEIATFARQLHDQEAIFGTLAGVRESVVNSRGGRHVVSFGYELRIRTQDGRHLHIVDSEEDAENGTRQAPGLLLVSRANFERIGGYNSDLHGWGWEDQDMISRLTLGLGLTRRTQGYAVHLSHDDQARIAHYPHVTSRWESRDRMFRTALANYDEGNFTGSYLRDRDQLSAALEIKEPESILVAVS